MSTILLTQLTIWSVLQHLSAVRAWSSLSAYWESDITAVRAALRLCRASAVVLPPEAAPVLVASSP
eukprot:scaffold204032_cov18-Prasinocladus_malaysianus.AAC.1